MIDKLRMNKHALNKGFFFLLVLFLFLQNIQYAKAAGSSIGQQDTLVMLLNFKENPNDQPITSEEAHALVFGEVSDFYQENSYGKTWLSGQVAGWYTLPVSNQVCDYPSVQAEADKMARADGIVLEDYQRIIYIMTQSGCAGGGSATTGKTFPSRAYIDGTLSARVIAHEFGHNLGLSHAKALDCGDASVSNNCSAIEYGDSYDVMGTPDMGYINTYYKERMGWLNDAESPNILTAIQDGLYEIAEYETQDITQNIALKIPRGVNPNTGLKEWFYVEYRQAMGYDQFLDDRSYMLFRGDVTDGVIVRLVEEGAEESYILHMKPNSDYSQVYGRKDWKDTALPVGDSFTDPVSGLTINLASAANGFAGVNVSFGGSVTPSVCEMSAPSVSVKATSDTQVNAGDTVEYQLTVTNTANDVCGTIRFDVSAQVESGWQASSQSISLASGESSMATIAVTSALSATSGDYPVTFNVVNTKDEAYNVATQATYAVAEQQTGSGDVVAVDDNVQMSKVSTVSINVLGNDIIADGVSVEISAMSAPSKGTVKLLSDGSIQYTPAKRFKNQDSFSYTITSGNVTSTAMVTVALQSSPDSGGSSPGKGKNK
ncbi:TPA: cadherin-like domain-containing protein [Vibrio parahaemolyticus]|uniref:Ig-like domain-containing protein n=1 Tax=Vibrio parahaemolyticus TaxID=670 RepID=UPI00193E2327|nr:Ig-like domain-containing protein [Vibrio parahaemolyticus]MBM5167284.1 cadherin-like domain-containing protein [Vibrio parahaemolyticus]MCR9974990.1 Ig-like domain-containing protein [Vibrio parahaemolyticus]MCS0020736.1 Ig-like domain-containing protein [Vibrio parahaemolyticus]MCS0054505.1 Ig-like domain-containing protein [Vibrio parahaemolyticus]HCG7400181.1 cadherin-like domain-containing protein [Vibrio parahaemolyticus]